MEALWKFHTFSNRMITKAVSTWGHSKLSPIQSWRVQILVSALQYSFYDTKLSKKFSDKILKSKASGTMMWLVWITCVIQNVYFYIMLPCYLVTSLARRLAECERMLCRKRAMCVVLKLFGTVLDAPEMFRERRFIFALLNETRGKIAGKNFTTLECQFRRIESVYPRNASSSLLHNQSSKNVSASAFH